MLLQHIIAGVCEVADRVEQCAIKVEYDKFFHALFLLFEPLVYNSLAVNLQSCCKFFDFDLQAFA